MKIMKEFLKNCRNLSYVLSNVIYFVCYNKGKKIEEIQIIRKIFSFLKKCNKTKEKIVLLSERYLLKGGLKYNEPRTKSEISIKVK